jgi:hypothetical protein
MKKVKIKLLGLFFLFVAGLIFTACEEQEDVLDQEEESMVELMQDESVASAEFDDLLTVSFGEALAGLAQSRQEVGADDRESAIAACARRIVDRENRTMIIDFGDVNCTGRDGRVRRGKVIIQFDQIPYTSMSISLEDYHVNDRLIEGTKTINRGFEDGKPYFEVQVRNASISSADVSISWESDRRVLMVEGFGTAAVDDDVFEVTGTISGVNRRGIAYSGSITEPLIRLRQRGCFFTFVAGVFEMEDERGNMLKIEYDTDGSQSCNREVRITINGRSVIREIRPNS